MLSRGATTAVCVNTHSGKMACVVIQARRGREGERERERGDKYSLRAISIHSSFILFSLADKKGKTRKMGGWKRRLLAADVFLDVFIFFFFFGEKSNEFNYTR